MKSCYKTLCKSLIINSLPSLIVVFSFLILSSCQNTPPQYDGKKTRFFDLEGYLTKEVAGHLTAVKTVKKTVTVNGQKEEKTVAIANWKDELDPFFKSDINRPAWSDFYLVKESPFANRGKLSEYYALKDHLKTRSMRVSDYSGVDVQVDIVNADNSLATQTQTQLHYDNTRGYTITTYQNLLGGKDSVQIDVQFLR